MHVGLDFAAGRVKLRPIPAVFEGLYEPAFTGFMNSSQSSQSPDKKPPAAPCKHPRVQIVSRDEESEFVECKECGEIFDSSEFKDMSIEETKLRDLEE